MTCGGTGKAIQAAIQEITGWWFHAKEVDSQRPASNYCRGSEHINQRRQIRVSSLVTMRPPSKYLARSLDEELSLMSEHRTIWKGFPLHSGAALISAIQPFSMQYLVHFTCPGPFQIAARALPCLGKCYSRLPPALKARAMASGKCRYFVEEEQFSIALTHYLAMTAFEFQNTGDPLFAGPATGWMQFAGCRIVDAPAAIAHKSAALGY